MKNKAKRIVNIYYFKRNFIVPTVLPHVDGFWIEGKPIAVLDESNLDGVEAIVAQRLQAPADAPIAGQAQGPWEVPKYAKARSAGAFHKAARLLTIEVRPDAIHVAPQKMDPEGGWADDLLKKAVFSLNEMGAVMMRVRAELGFMLAK